MNSSSCLVLTFRSRILGNGDVRALLMGDGGLDEGKGNMLEYPATTHNSLIVLEERHKQ